MKLCLINQKNYTSKVSGDPKIKLIFISDKGLFYAGYGDPAAVLPEVSEMEKVGTYDDAHARELDVDIDVFDGRKQEKVVITS